MKCESHIFNGKEIHVFDDVFSFNDRIKFYNFLRNSQYVIIGGGGQTIEDMSSMALQCMFTELDINALGMIQILPKEINDIFENYKLTRPYSLLVSYLQKSHFHVDNHPNENQKVYTLLYYANLTWQNDWGGETVFLNKNADEVIYTSLYKPGRIIIFDSTIPHKPCTQTFNAPQFRFTFVTNYVENKQKSIL